MIESHRLRLAIRSLKRIVQGVIQTVSAVGSRFVVRNSIVADAVLGIENLDLRGDWRSWEGRGHHFERDVTTI